MLVIRDLTYRIAGRLLFDQASATVGVGQRAGLVGPNGAGKSTLLRLILGEISPDSGGVEVPARWRIGSVPQEAPGGAETPLEVVLAADSERASLMAEAETATDPARIATIHTRLVDIGAHEAPARAASILAGLGFDEAMQARPCSSYSGGIRMRVALAATLFSQPDLLLLDEPTNHLDLETTVWLESFLKRYPGTLLIVSHDRALLNNAVDRILHVEGMKLVGYSGGYDRFLRTQAERLEHLEAERARLEAARKHMQAFVDRFRYKASKARQAQSRLKAIARMPEIPTLAPIESVQFAFPSPPSLAPPLLTMEKAAVGYDGKPVLRGLDLRLDPDDRVALLGANGNGKSTLIKLMAGRLEPLQGKVVRAPKLGVGYFAQHQADELVPRRRAVDEVLARAPDMKETAARSHLGRFGLSQTRGETETGKLSGGEKARLLLALMSLKAPHILLLDEPTNHLDIDSRQALVEAINGFGGAVVLITHDPHLIELAADRLWLVADGTVRPFDGDLDDYRLQLSGGEPRRAESQAAGAPDNKRQQRREAADARAQIAPLRKAARKAEAEVERLTNEKRKIEAKLADPTLYGGPPEAVTRLQVALHEASKALEAAETAWLEAEGAIEEAAA